MTKYHLRSKIYVGSNQLLIKPQREAFEEIVKGLFEIQLQFISSFSEDRSSKY